MNSTSKEIFPSTCAANDSSISLPLLDGMTKVEYVFVIGQVLASKF
jgi:hypothetical protein